MRIAVVCYLYDPAGLPPHLPVGARTGSQPHAGCFVREQAAALARLGLDVEMLTPALYLFSLRRPLRSWREYRRLGTLELPGAVRERVAFWPCRAFLTAPPFNALALGLQSRALGRMLDAGPRPDLIHAHFAFPTGCYVQRAARRRGIPYVVTVHESYFEKAAGRALLRRPLRATLAGARRIVCVSSSLREKVLRQFPEQGRRAEVIPNGVDPEVFRPPDRPAAAGAGGGPGPRLILVANLVPVKRPDLLVRAVSELRRAGLPATAAIVGQGPMEPELRALAAGLGVADAVRVTALPRAELPRFMREEGDVFVLPSDSETFGVVLLEALASGVPVVATRCGGPEDIVTAEVGRLAPPGDLAGLVAAIREVWTRRAEFPPERLAAHARRLFSSGSVAGRLAALYEQALKGHAE